MIHGTGPSSSEAMADQQANRRAAGLTVVLADSQARSA